MLGFQEKKLQAREGKRERESVTGGEGGEEDNRREIIDGVVLIQIDIRRQRICFVINDIIDFTNKSAIYDKV